MEQNRQFSNEMNERMYNEMMNVLEHGDTCEYPELEAFSDWLDELRSNLMEAVSKSLKTVPTKEGVGESVVIGLARFICTVLEKMQRNGMVTEGNDAYQNFTEVLMPVAHKLVIDEMDAKENLQAEAKNIGDSMDLSEDQQQAAMAIFEALCGTKMTEEEIYEKYVGKEAEGSRESYVQQFREMRAEIRRRQQESK